MLKRSSELMSSSTADHKASWLTGYQSFGIHGLTNYPVVADYPQELKKQVVDDAMQNKISIMAELREERRRQRDRTQASSLIQRAYRSRPTGVDHVINNKTALGIRP